GVAGTTGAAGRGGTTGAAGTTGSAGTTGAGGSSSGGLTLTIEANPNSVLSCYVSWKTTAPAESVVQFGVGNPTQWEISDAATVTDHRVLIIGMRANQTYAIKAISGAQSGTGSFKTGALPANIPVGTISVNDTARAQAGWTLMNMQRVNATTGSGVVIPNSPYPPMAVIYDSEGQPVWYVIDGTSPDNGGAVSTLLTDKGILVGPTWNAQQTTGTPPREFDFAGNIIWECKHAACAAGKSVSHHAGKLSNGHYVIIEDVTVNNVKSPVFREITADNQEVWSLDWAKLVPPPAGAMTDWCHGNSITIDIAKNEVYANCRWVGLLKTTYTNPTKQWLMPASCASMGLGDITYSGTQYVDSHDPEIHSDGTILFYDNGGWNTRCPMSQYHSRIVEYQVDQTMKKATLTWQFPGSFSVTDTFYTSWYAAYWGDANRLANGNVLVVAGVLSPTLQTHIAEVVKADGKIVWELKFPNFYGAYRATRITPPLVHAIMP
ncbi:MAG TPA: aryl-sulfate sulfotransferase, partial [Polyangia bacterium]